MQPLCQKKGGPACRGLREPPGPVLIILSMAHKQVYGVFDNVNRTHFVSEEYDFVILFFPSTSLCLQKNSQCEPINFIIKKCSYEHFE